MASPAQSTFTTRPEIAGTFGVVSSTHWIASQVGMSILEKGGNAFDAAVAAGLTLQVVEPHMNGLGGDAVLIACEADGKPKVICGQGVAPAKATIAHYRAQGIETIPGTGLLAAVVPGAFDAWMTLLRDHGTMTLAEVMSPAIGYAKDGYPLLPGVCGAVQSVSEIFKTEWKSSAATWMPGGNVPTAGTLFANPKLADTLQRLLAEGASAGPDREAQIEKARDAYYKGFVAEAIDRFCRENEVMDVSGKRHKGVLSADDMAAWRAPVEAPATYDYRGITVCKAGPWSQGPVLLQVLALLQGYDVPSMDTTGPEFIHLLIEATKIAYADREAWYADPDFADVPLKTMLSDKYNAERRKLIGDTANFDLRPGTPDGRNPALPKFNVAGVKKMIPGMGGFGEPARVESDALATERYRDGGASAMARNARAARGPAEGDTCHLDVIDRWGNTVACTPSGGWLQSSPTVPDLGFCLGTRGQMFWLQEGLPSSLTPKMRPRTTLTPSMAMKDGKPWMAFGSPGGDNQDQWIAQFFLRHVDHKLNMQAAMDAPMLQTDHWPNSFFPREARPGKVQLESRFPKETVEALKAKGHDIEIGGEWSLGRNAAAKREGKLMKAAATPRLQQAYAVGR
ncbi:MAG: gamma-glutamyltransferase family protein [Rhodospirillales bacterium]|nr:gamma-glutamyltransferase family protein [Rhodospirillales bacterium]